MQCLRIMVLANPALLGRLAAQVCVLRLHRANIMPHTCSHLSQLALHLELTFEKHAVQFDPLRLHLVQISICI